MKILMVMVLAVVGAASAANAAPAATGVAAAYAKSCKSCHGEDGRGNPKMAKVLKVTDAALDLTDEATLKKDDKTLAAVIATGLVDGKKTRMPGYEKKLKPAEIDALVAYIRELAKAKK